MRGTIAGLLLVLCALVAPSALAVDANELTIHQSIRINAPAEKVWGVIGDFNGLPRWLATIAESKIILGKNNEVGAIRQFTRRNGTKATERLIDYDPAAMRIGYTYVDGAILASDYFPVITVKDAGDGSSIVDWNARLKRLAYATDPPPAGQDDTALTEFFNGIYKAGLENLKRVIEAEEAR